jgi:hypothetical protein
MKGRLVLVRKTAVLVLQMGQSIVPIWRRAGSKVTTTGLVELSLFSVTVVYILAEVFRDLSVIMADQEKAKPTTPVPILVASGSGGDHAAEFYLTFMDWLLRDEMGVLGDLEGEISAWISECFAKPVQFERHNIPEQNKGAVQREVMREFFAITADPRRKEEMQIGSLLEGVYSEDLNRTLVALQRGDHSAAEKIRAELVERISQTFTKQVTKASISALGSLVARGRASRVGALCMVLYKKNPLSLIDQARRGNREAVLKLIKLDKLFLTDSCTAQVIRRAELQNDRIFLGQLARAVTYKPKTNWRQGCRLYIYMFCMLGVEMPSSTTLLHRVDPDGKHFASSGAFERFVERTRKEFDRIQIKVIADNPEKA